MSGAVLSNHGIIEAMKTGDVKISNFIEDNLTNVGYDMTLGRDGIFESTGEGLVDLSEKREVAKSWNPIDMSNSAGLLIQPGESFLASTNEMAGTSGESSLTSLIKARSTVVRAGLTVSASGGWGDIGFYGKWGVLLHNTRRDRPIFIPFGTRICQIIFLTTTSGTDRAYTGYGGETILVND